LSTVTPNFNWPVPTSTDLVKDGATAIEALGDSIDASLVDLKGGTSGQVLSKNSNTDMDFVWVTSDDANAIQNTIVDAKGDLITATAADTPARLAVGANGETLVADSSASVGIRYQANFSAGKNKIINGDFGVWQRGTSFSTTVDMFTADRFFIQKNNTNTISQQTFTPGTAPVAGYEGQYFLRYARTTTASGSDFFYQRIEDVRTFAGQTVTFSFWAKADSALLIGGIEIDQIFGTGGSGTVSTTLTASGSTGFSVTTSWVRYSWTATLPSIASKTIGSGSHIRPRINFVGAAATFDTWGWQLEAGNTATAFQTATGTIQGELAACQRYYVRFNATQNYSYFGAGVSRSTNQTDAQIRFPVTMRTNASSVDFSTLGVTNNYNTALSGTISSVALDTASNTNNAADVLITMTSGALTTDKYYYLVANNSTSAYIGFSAEL
jgi:hypothetical protein